MALKIIDFDNDSIDSQVAGSLAHSTRGSRVQRMAIRIKYSYTLKGDQSVRMSLNADSGYSQSRAPMNDYVMYDT